jgi:hypothetical protein
MAEMVRSEGTVREGLVGVAAVEVTEELVPVAAEGILAAVEVQTKETVREVEGVVHIQWVHSLQARLQIWEWGMLS